MGGIATSVRTLKTHGTVYISVTRLTVNSLTFPFANATKVKNELVQEMYSRGTEVLGY